MKQIVAAFVLIVSVMVAACDPRTPGAEAPEIRHQRLAAFRQACAARALLVRAGDDLETLAAVLATAEAGDDPAIGRGFAVATHEFARAYHQHAELRARAYAYLDSAVNHAATAADSVRFIERAATFTIRLPAGGTVEANVLDQYQRELTALLSDADHRCNWDLPF